MDALIKPPPKGDAPRPYVVRTETNGRENNEDTWDVQTFLSRSNQVLTTLAVADGMGGHEHGEEASQQGLHKLFVALYEGIRQRPAPPAADSIDPESIGRTIKSALEIADAHVKKIIEANRWGKAGSTVVVAIILGDTAIIGNLGDSPCYHYRRVDHKLRKVTDDHTVAGVLLRAGMISPAMARVHEGKSRLEFFLGRGQLPRDTPLYQVRLAPGDLLLLCSDGVTGSLPDAQLTEILAAPNLDLEQKADALLRAGVDAGETDNQTLILWQHPRSATATVIVEDSALPEGRPAQGESAAREGKSEGEPPKEGAAGANGAPIDSATQQLPPPPSAHVQRTIASRKADDADKKGA